MNLLELPDLCLIAILDRLPIRDLLQSGRVCSRFYATQRAACLEKRSLRILNFTDCRHYGVYVEQDELDFYRIDNFHLLTKYEDVQQQPGLTASMQYDMVINEKNCDMLAQTFPNIERFTVVDNYKFQSSNISRQQCLMRLITNWSSSLKHLTVIGKFNDRLLSDTINQLLVLENFSGNAPPLDRLAPLSVMSQLVEFNCKYSRDLAELLTEVLTEHDNIRQFGLDMCLPLEDWTPAIGHKLTRLKIHVTDLAQLDKVSTFCDSITYLDLGFGSFYSGELGTIFSHIARLPKLTELKLNIFFDAFSLQPDNLFNEPNLPRLASVKQVELRFPFDPHQLDLVEAAFPSARRIIIRISARQFVSFYTHLFCTANCPNCLYMRSVVMRCAESRTGGADSVCFSIKNGRIESHDIVVPR